MYDAVPDLAYIYDNVPLYTSRRDTQFYVDEAKAVAGSVLELGCGTGRVLLPIARAGYAIDGLDSSPQMLERCETKLLAEPASVKERAHLHRGDVRSFNLGKKFDLVTAPFRVLQHLTTVEDQLAFLDAVARHLQPGGRFCFDVFNPNFAALVAADGLEHEDTPGAPLPDGRSFRRMGRVRRVRWIDQVSEIELIYYLSEKSTQPLTGTCTRSTCAGSCSPSCSTCLPGGDSVCARFTVTSTGLRWRTGRQSRSCAQY